MDQARTLLTNAKGYLSGALPQLFDLLQSTPVDTRSSRIETDVDKKISALRFAIIMAGTGFTASIVFNWINHIVSILPIIGSIIVSVIELIKQAVILGCCYLGTKALLSSEPWYRDLYDSYTLDAVRYFLPPPQICETDRAREARKITINSIGSFDDLQKHVRGHFMFELKQHGPLENQKKDVVRLDREYELFTHSKSVFEDNMKAYQALDDDELPERRSEVRQYCMGAFFEMLDFARQYLETRLILQESMQGKLEDHFALTPRNQRAWQYNDPTALKEEVYIKSEKSSLTYANFLNPKVNVMFDAMVDELKKTLTDKS